MPYPRKATAEAIADMEQVARKRLAARAVTNQDIADRHHLPLVVVNRWMSRIYETLKGSTTNTETVQISDDEIERLRSLG
jgi:uncharacterized protein (DUF2336 family)